MKEKSKATSNTIKNKINNGIANQQNLNGQENKSNGNVSNSMESTSLWIGNVDPNVSEETLTQMFAAFGSLSNVRCLPEKYCAFVNFKLRDDANKAMQNLQV
jgi:RNA recognition motif-containing protein